MQDDDARDFNDYLGSIGKSHLGDSPEQDQLKQEFFNRGVQRKDPNETLARFGSPYDRQYIAHQKWLNQREEQRKQLIEREKEKV